jgi:cytosine permease
MGRFCFGEAGSRLSDFPGLRRTGLVRLGHRDRGDRAGQVAGPGGGFTVPLMVLFGLGFSITAIIGFKGLDLLSRVSVPLMFALLLVSMYIATAMPVALPAWRRWYRMKP